MRTAKRAQRLSAIAVGGALFLTAACSAAESSDPGPDESTVSTPEASPSGTTAQGSASARPVPANGLDMAFVNVPAGRFVMGAGDSDAEANDAERPSHKVTISRPFEIGRYEVTQQQWEAVTGSNPYTLDRSNPYYAMPGMAERITRPEHPATVSWEDAQAFLARLNRLDDGFRHRLPTEAEWEYAARAGTTTAYSFGDDDDRLNRYAWYGEDFAAGGSHPVGQKEPNPWGLYDVHGNAWEWVQDFYDPTYYLDSPSVDPAGPASGNERVVRGGSWHETGNGWRSASRRDYAPDYRGISIGLRVVRTSATEATPSATSSSPD